MTKWKIVSRAGSFPKAYEQRQPHYWPIHSRQYAEKHDAIWALIEPFGRARLNEEYLGLCRKLLAVLARKRPSPLLNGTAAAWTCAIIRTIGWVNFLDDPSRTPHVKMTDVDKAFGVSSGTGQTKSKSIRDMLKIHQFAVDWSLPSTIVRIQRRGWCRSTGSSWTPGRCRAKCRKRHSAVA